MIVSEPMGFLLVHERMLESYIAARDRFLKPGGLMMPSWGTIYIAPFTDSTLYQEQVRTKRPRLCHMDLVFSPCSTLASLASSFSSFLSCYILLVSAPKFSHSLCLCVLFSLISCLPVGQEHFLAEHRHVRP